MIVITADKIAKKSDIINVYSFCTHMVV